MTVSNIHQNLVKPVYTNDQKEETFNSENLQNFLLLSYQLMEALRGLAETLEKEETKSIQTLNKTLKKEYDKSKDNAMESSAAFNTQSWKSILYGFGAVAIHLGQSVTSQGTYQNVLLTSLTPLPDFGKEELQSFSQKDQKQIEADLSPINHNIEVFKSQRGIIEGEISGIKQLLNELMSTTVKLQEELSSKGYSFNR